ncbi:hypothetical protein BT93_C1881 [Corymbia citriodora subsp. variegata]|nr:hypothetical protein BT93_C1881 [Corymbia citriodora subsp. variegata]
MIQRPYHPFCFFHFHIVTTHGYTSQVLIATILTCLAFSYHRTELYSSAKCVKDLVIHLTKIVVKSACVGLMSCHSYVPKI